MKYYGKTIIQSNDSTTCDPWTAREFTTHMEEETECPHCLADCELTTYSTTITSSEFRWKREKSRVKDSFLSPGCVTQET